MSTRKILMASTGRGVMLASIAALVLTMAEPPFAVTASPFASAPKGRSLQPLPAMPPISVLPATAGTTDVEATLRDWPSWGWQSGPYGAVAAQQRRDDYYDNGYGYGSGYYGGGPYYGRGYSR